MSNNPLYRLLRCRKPVQLITSRKIPVRTDSFPMSDIDTLNGIAEWAAYHAHGNIFHCE